MAHEEKYFQAAVASPEWTSEPFAGISGKRAGRWEEWTDRKIENNPSMMEMIHPLSPQITKLYTSEVEISKTSFQ